MTAAMEGYHIIRPADHEQWLAERRKGLGSSEAGTVLGVSHFDTPLQLWRRKTGLDSPVEETEAMELGHAVEPGVAYMFAKRTGATIDPSSEGDWIAVDDRRDYLRVSPDRLFWPAGTPPEERTIENALMLECKTTSRRIDPDDIPDYWFCQVQYQMGVLRIPRCAVGWISWAGGTAHFDYTYVEFNPGFYGMLADRIDEFWNGHVLTGIEPETVVTREDALLRFPRADEGSVLTVGDDDEVAAAVRRYNAARTREAAAKEEKDLAEAAITAAMGTREKMVTASGEVLATWRNTAGRTSFNARGFQEANPEEYSRWLVTSGGGRRLTVKNFTNQNY